MKTLRQRFEDLSVGLTGFGATTVLILQDVNITDITQSLKDIIGIVPPVLYKFVSVVVAIMIMVMIMAITGILPKLMNSLVKKMD